MKIVQKKLTDLKTMEKNVRRHSQKQITEYARSLRMFGQVRPMVVDENGVILVGNGLYEALRSIGADKADCYVMTGMSEAEKKKLMLADNRIYELGMTDTDTFDEIIRSLNGDVDVPGWDADLLETLNASVKEVSQMVESYGSYQPEDMQKYHNRQEASSGPLQQPAGTEAAPGQVFAYPQAQAQEAATEARETRFVICPKCGERIEIGGV